MRNYTGAKKLPNRGMVLAWLQSYVPLTWLWCGGGRPVLMCWGNGVLPDTAASVDLSTIPSVCSFALMRVNP